MPYVFEPYPDRGRIRFLQERDFGDVINVTFRLLRETLRPALLSQLYVAGPALLLLVAAVVLLGGRALLDPAVLATSNPEDVLISIGPFVGVVYIAYMIAAVLSQATAFSVILGYRAGDLEDLSPSACWERTRPLLLPLVGVMFAMMAVGFGLALLAVPLLLLPIVAIIALVAGFVYLLPVVQLIIPARLLETEGAWAALRRALDLVRTNWIRAFGTVFVGILIMYVLLIVLSIPGAVLSSVAAAFGVEVIAIAGSAIAGALQVFSLLLINAYLAALVSLLHGSLKEEGEGSGLIADLDQLAGGVLDDHPSELPPARASDPTALERADALPESSAPAAEPNDAPAHPETPPGGGFRGGGFGA